MYTVTEAFKTAMESNIKSLTTWLIYKNHDQVNVTLTDSDALVSVQVSAEGELGSSSMRKVDVEFIKSELPDSFYEVKNGEYFGLIYGVMIEEDIYNYVAFGNFKITEIKNSEDSDTISWTAYDKMYDTIVPYESVAPNPSYWVTEHTLSDYLAEVLKVCDIQLGNTDFVHHNLKINSDRFVSWVESVGNVAGHWVSNSYGYKARDLINDICKISGTVAIISNDNKLYFKTLNPVNPIYTTAVSNLVSYKENERYGYVNRVIFAREPQGDYSAAKSHQNSIDDYKLTEWKVDNNQLIDYQPIIEPARLLTYNSTEPVSSTNVPPTAPQDYRNQSLDATFDAVCGTNPDGTLGISYFPFDAETVGYGWFEIGDKVRFGSNDTLILGYSVKLDGGITEKLYARKTNVTDTKLKHTSKKYENQTQLVVDKQNQIITGFIQKTNEFNKEISKTTQTSTSWQANFYVEGGANLLKNSVMYAYTTENYAPIPESWTRVSGALEIAEIGGISKSGNAFAIGGGSVYQVATFLARPNIKYSLGFKFRKDNGSASYTVEWAESSEIVPLTSDKVDTYTKESYTKISTNGGYIKITFTSDTNVWLVLTDVMLCEGEESKEWTQYQGEITNGSVTLTGQGIRISGTGNLETIITDSSLISKSKSSDNIQFKIDSQETKVKHLVADDLSIPPIKIVRTADAWAFVSTPITEGIII